MVAGECSKANNDNIALNSVNSIGSVLCNLISDDTSVYLRRNRRTRVERADGRRGRCINADGPKPMRNFKPVEKRRTGAEGFEILHQSAYESQASEHGMPRMEDRSYPQMREELTRKRSTGKIIMAKRRRPAAEGFGILRQSPYESQVSENGMPQNAEKTGSQTREELAKKRSNDDKVSMGKASNKPQKRIKRRYQSRCRRRRRITKPRGVTKRRPRPKCATSGKLINKSCQFKYCAINNSEKSVSTNDRSDNELTLGPNRNKFTKTYDRYYEGAKSGARRSIASISTYNSYLSMEHEPMI